MVLTDLARLNPAELLALHARIGDELRQRGVVRSANNPTGDLAEHLFCRAYGWKQAGNSNPMADASDRAGRLFQIKGRRQTRRQPSRILGAMRGLPEGGFDFLAAVLFEPDYRVRKAAIIPHPLVHSNSRYIEYTNSWRFNLSDAVWALDGVEDATEKLRAVTI